MFEEMEESSDTEYFPGEEEEMDTEEEEEEYEDATAEDRRWDDDDPNDPDYVDEEEDEDDSGIQFDRILFEANPGLLRQIQQVLQRGLGLRSSDAFDEPPPRRRRERRFEVPQVPSEAGKRLLYSGEFGEIDDSTTMKRRYEKAKNMSQFARLRELGWKRSSTISITKKWLPQEARGELVQQYNRHVYSGQFSHDGSFFYTAGQDFQCRMYSTPNPADPKDWRLYKVPPTSVIY